MSGYKPVAAEVLYSRYIPATTSTPTASPGSSMIVGYPPVIVPAGYMDKLGAWSSSLKLKMGGQAAVTATVPTWQFFLYCAVATTSAPAFSSGTTVVSSATFTPTAATNQWWDLELEIGLQAIALGAASTVTAWGKWTCPTFPSPFYVTIPANNASYTPLATWDNSQSYVLWPALSLGAGTAGNTVTTQYLKLYGEV